VNSHDFDLLAANFGATGLSHAAAAGDELASGSGQGVAPEPASLVLLGLGGLLLMSRRRPSRQAVNECCLEAD
jgi:hypothetical protein